MSQQLPEIPEQMREEYINWFTYLYQAELFGADVFGSWILEVRLADDDMARLNHHQGKMTYDEARHSDIAKRMLQHFGGDEAVENAHQKYREQGTKSYRERMTSIFSQGPDNVTEFLTTLPLTADAPGIDIFADMAQCSPDPLWSDAAESISDDEKLHGSLAAEFLPVMVEKRGDEARADIQRGLDRWLPIMFAHQGHPESKIRDRMIDAGIISLTTRDVHEIMYENIHDVLDPLGVDVPHYDGDELMRAKEAIEYGERLVEQQNA
jgi:1,2-phenylacetyl-CoA epoxidase catalytic subunit